MSLRDELASQHPDFPLLDPAAPEGVEAFLRERGWIDESEGFEGCARAGEGNMNLTLRVRTDRRSLILKQSRPWVEKYETIPAPFDRAQVEERFYRRVAAIEGVADRMPRLLAADAEGRALLLEDLGEAGDLTSLYATDDLAFEEARELGSYLRALHMGTLDDFDESLANREMRALNHEHLFEVPLRPDNGLDLDTFEPGLGEAARSLQADDAFRAAVAELGRRYLADGRCLVHGDFFPGSWLRSGQGLRVIDPEFSFFGDPELDLGVAIAHLVLGRQYFALDLELIEAAVDPSPELVVEEALVAQYAGVEVMRRLIGVAQLPIPPTGGAGKPGFRASMLDRARVAVLEQTLEAFRT